MIVQRTEPALGVGRRLRILPQPSCPPSDGFTHNDSYSSQTSTNYMAMRINDNQFRDDGAFRGCIEPPSNCFPETYSRSKIGQISIKDDAFKEWESFPSPRRYTDSVHSSFSTGSPPGPSKYFIRIYFHNQRIVPSLIRLADDLTGKEAGQETQIGDKIYVTKYIN